MSGPQPPPRLSSQSLPTSTPKVTFKGAESWRESLGTYLAIGLSIAVFTSLICLGFYSFRNKQVFEEVVDYLDKTISISKINFNHQLGLYQLSEKEMQAVGEIRTYKTLMWCWLLADAGCFVFLTLAVLLYFSGRAGEGVMRKVYWVVLLAGALYCIVEIHMFTFIMYPYSGTLPNRTEALLNHAIPHNPGGLMQMEQRLDCTFDYNLYGGNQRRLNPRNTCDPAIASSYLSPPLLLTLLILRLLPVVLFVLLAAKRTPVSESLAMALEKLRPTQKKRLYVKKQHYRQSTYQVDMSKPKTTGNMQAAPRPGSTWFASRPGSALPPPSPAGVDHSISYNNAAYIATSGAIGLNSSRNSDISRIDAVDLYRPATLSHHASGSLMSDV